MWRNKKLHLQFPIGFIAWNALKSEKTWIAIWIRDTTKNLWNKSWSLFSRDNQPDEKRIRELLDPNFWPVMNGKFYYMPKILHSDWLMDWQSDLTQIWGENVLDFYILPASQWVTKELILHFLDGSTRFYRCWCCLPDQGSTELRLLPEVGADAKKIFFFRDILAGF